MLRAIGEGYPVPAGPEPRQPAELRTIRDLMRTDFMNAARNMGYELIDMQAAFQRHRHTNCLGPLRFAVSDSVEHASDL